MELDFIAAMTISIVGVENGWVRVGKSAPFDHFGAAADAAEVFKVRASPAGAFPGHRVPQGTIDGERIVIDKRRRLVQDFVIHESIVMPVYCAGLFFVGRDLGVDEVMNNCSACCSEIERLKCVVAPLAVKVAASP